MSAVPQRRGFDQTVNRDIHDLRDDLGQLVAMVNRLIEDVKEVTSCVHSLKGEIARYKGLLAGIALTIGLLPAVIPFLKNLLR